MQNGLCWELTMFDPRHRTDARGSGFWLTPSTVQINPSADRRKKRTAYRESVGRHDIPGRLTEQVMTPKFWPTPRVSDTEGGIVKNVEMKDGSFSRVNKDGVRWGVKLKDAVDHAEKMWPTPAARDYKGQNSVETMKRKIAEGKRAQQGQLPNAVAMQGDRGQLNSKWVSWLMGWPIGWVDLEPMKEIEFLPFDPEPAIPRVTTGEKDRAKKLKALGNGQVPQCAALAWKILNDSI